MERNQFSHRCRTNEIATPPNRFSRIGLLLRRNGTPELFRMWSFAKTILRIRHFPKQTVCMRKHQSQRKSPEKPATPTVFTRNLYHGCAEKRRNSQATRRISQETKPDPAFLE